MSSGGNKCGDNRTSLLRPNVRRMDSSRGGFTLLEVMIALAILAVSLLILVSAQGSAANMSAQADRILIGSMLARQKLSETVLLLEKDGFSEQEELEEDGDFEESAPGAYPEFRWRTRIRKVEVEDISRVLDGAQSAGADMGESEGAEAPEMDNSAMGGVMDTISQTLAERVREVTVRVEWAEGESMDDVTLIDYVTRP